MPGETDPNVARVAGFQRTYDFDRKLSIDLLTVKGAGRHVATVRSHLRRRKSIQSALGSTRSGTADVREFLDDRA